MDSVNQLLPHIATFSALLPAANTRQAIAQSICKAVQNAGLKDCVVYYANPHKSELEQLAAIGEKLSRDGKIQNPIRLKYGQGIVGMVALFRKDIIIDDTRLTPNYVVDDQSRLSELTVPIIYDDQLLGVIDSEHDEQAYFGDFHRQLFQVLATMAAPQLSIAIANEQTNEQSVSPTPIEQYKINQKLDSENVSSVEKKQANYDQQVTELLSMIDADEFQKIVAGLLKNYHKPNALSGLPKLKSLLAGYEDKAFSSFFIETLKEAIRHACDELFLPTPKTQKFHYIIEHTYFKPLANHQAVADHLGMSYSSFNRHLGNARREIASYVWVKLHKQNNIALRAC